MRCLSGRDAFYGALIYASGDSAAAWLNGEFQYSRLFGMALLGGSLYAVEIPAYFRWIERRFNPSLSGNAWRRALLGLAFFNPLWIARHMAFIKAFSGRWADVHWDVLDIAAVSFAHAAPAALLINYWIQNGIPLAWRFFASSLFSALMAVYFALSEAWFG